MNKKEDTIKEVLALYGKESIDDLPDEALVDIITLITPPMYGGAITIYEESDEKERKAFVKDIKRCIKKEARIFYYLVNEEGVSTEKTEEMFDFASKHSVWYEIKEI